MNDFSFRPMTEDDLTGADELRQLMGWNQTPADWRRFLDSDPHGCFVATRDGVVVGTVTTITYGRTLAWIGMMLVHPDCRRRGIGKCLMSVSLEYLQSRGVPCIKLDATPAGFPLYEQLGFVSEWTLTRWQRPAEIKAALPNGTLDDSREIGEADWSVVERIDAEAFGVPRASLIRSLAQHSRSALVWPAQGPVTGWGLIRAGANADYLGPLVCSNTAGSLALLQALLRIAGNRSVFWDVPDENLAAKTAVQRWGFSPVRPLTRMRLGPPVVKSDPQAQFAIADPAVG